MNKKNKLSQIGTSKLLLVFLAAIILIPFVINMFYQNGFGLTYIGYLGATIGGFAAGLLPFLGKKLENKPVLFCERLKQTDEEFSENNIEVILKNCGIGPAIGIETVKVLLLGKESPYDKLDSCSLNNACEIKYLIPIRRSIIDVTIDQWPEKTLIRNSDKKEEWIMHKGLCFTLHYEDCASTRYKCNYEADIRIRDECDVFPIQEITKITNGSPEEIKA